MPINDMDDGVFIGYDGRLYNIPFTTIYRGPCSCECDGENPYCEPGQNNSRCLPCVMNCPGFKVFGPTPSEIELCQMTHAHQTAKQRQGELN